MIISNPMEFFIKPPARRLLSKMVLLNGKTDIYLRLLVLFYLELVPNQHWGDVVTTAVHFVNRMPSKVLDFKTPL